MMYQIITDETETGSEPEFELGRVLRTAIRCPLRGF